MRIVGTTYPDVILGQWVGENANRDLARLSVIAFQDLINPALAAAYAAAGGRFVDVTAATGGYGSLDELVALPSGRLVPRPVAASAGSPTTASSATSTLARAATG